MSQGKFSSWLNRKANGYDCFWLSNFLKCTSNTHPEILLSFIIGSTSWFPSCLRLWANFSFKEIKMQSLYVMCPGCDTCRCQNQCKELNLSCLKLPALLLSSYLRDRPPCMWLCSRKLTTSPSLYPSTWYILSMTTSKWKVGIHTKLGQNWGCSLNRRVKGILHAETAVWPSWPSLYQRSEQQDWCTVVLPC